MARSLSIFHATLLSYERNELMATVIGPNDGKLGFLGSIGVRFMIDGEDAGGDFSLVEHPLSPRALAAPIHRHTREDEYSFVLTGRIDRKSTRLNSSHIPLSR